MKKMELKITLTFVIIFVASAIVTVIYNLVTMQESFYTFGVVGNAFCFGFIYLVYIWLFTRRHFLLAMLGLISVSFTALLFSFSSGALEMIKEKWDWTYTVMLIYFLVIGAIAQKQAQKLMEEDKINVNVNIDINGDVNNEDINIKINGDVVNNEDIKIDIK